MKTFWWNKSRRAQSSTDFETCVEGEVVPTIIVMRNREGKPGGGKGPLISEDKSFTLATSNDQVIVSTINNTITASLYHKGSLNNQDVDSGHLIIFYANRVADIRLQDDKINTLQSRMGTGGNNMPMVATTKVRRLTPKECERLQGFPDDWTVSQSDSARYKQMGNAVAVPVVDWLIKGFTN